MASILTNKLALQAASSLNAASTSLQNVQKRASTGLKVGGAKDDGAIYSVAQKMRGELSGWRAVGDALARGQSFLDVAAAASRTVSDLLIDAKAKAASLQDAQDPPARAAIQADIAALFRQIDQTARAAAFDGVNLLTSKAGAPSVIDLNPPGGGPLPTASFSADVGTGSGSVRLHMVWENNFTFQTSLDGQLFFDPSWAYTGDITQSFHRPASVSPIMQIDLNTVLPPGPPPLAPYGVTILSARFFPDRPAGTEQILAAPDGDVVDVDHRPMTPADLDLEPTDWSDPLALVGRIDAAFDFVNRSAAYFATRQRLIEGVQAQAAKLMDSMDAGVGNLVDADVAKESAKLQAAQVKEQLAARTLSIANARPDWLLGLFKN